MPLPTPFHPRTAALCSSLFWKEWAGCHAVRSYDTCHQREYFALRHAAGLIDVSPLYKYEVWGAGAGEFLAEVLVRDPRKMAVGRVSYLCWCDDAGKLLDDGTVSRLDQDHYRVTAAEPAGAWFERHIRGRRVTVRDVTERLAALALQGPNSREILRQVCDADLDALRFFRVVPATIEGAAVHLSRTGYTGDLGYEIWIRNDDALDVWDAIMAAGRAYRIEPVGLDALDVARVEAGFIMNGVDYFGAQHCMIESRKSSPFELGLGWTVKLDRDPFIGQRALREERGSGSPWSLVGLEIDWDEFEALHDEVGLPPNVPSGAWRTALPVYSERGRQIGQATSGTWSPILKQNLALASVESRAAAIGTRLQIEVTVEYRRRQVTATVARTPFFNPGRKRA
jgi:aminomethyltransferase